MAKGITQEQVNQAADSLLLVGERPTIERIRAALGTGSPNTVNRLLDEWWVDLGERLTMSQKKVSLPEAPAEIGMLANQFWELALSTAQTNALTLVESERQDVATQRSVLAAKRVQYEEQVNQMSVERDAATADRDTALLRLADLQRLLDQQSAQLSDLACQRDNALSEAVTSAEKLSASVITFKQQQTSWVDQRTALEATHTAMQDRWLGEVDRARQDEMKLAAKLKQIEHATGASTKKAGEYIAELTKRLQQTEREEAKTTTRITSLEGEIQRLHVQLKVRLQVSPPSAAPRLKKAKKTS